MHADSARQVTRRECGALSHAAVKSDELSHSRPPGLWSLIRSAVDLLRCNSLAAICAAEPSRSAQDSTFHRGAPSCSGCLCPDAESIGSETRSAGSLRIRVRLRHSDRIAAPWNARAAWQPGPAASNRGPCPRLSTESPGALGWSVVRSRGSNELRGQRIWRRASAQRICRCSAAPLRPMRLPAPLPLRTQGLRRQERRGRRRQRPSTTANRPAIAPQSTTTVRP